MTTQRETSHRNQILALRRQVDELERRNDELALWADKAGEMQTECAALQVRANTAEDKLAALSTPVDTEDTPLSPDAARWADAYFATLKRLGEVRTERDAARTEARESEDRYAIEQMKRIAGNEFLKVAQEQLNAARAEATALRERLEAAEAILGALTATGWTIYTDRDDADIVRRCMPALLNWLRQADDALRAAGQGEEVLE